MMNAIFLFLTFLLMALLTTADDIQQQQAEISSIKAKPDVSEFVRQLSDSAWSRRKRSLGFYANEVLGGVAEREQEAEEMDGLGEGEDDQEAEGLAEREDDEGLAAESEEEDVEERANAEHEKAHAALKRIHTAMNQKTHAQDDAKMHKKQAKKQKQAKMQKQQMKLHKRHNDCKIQGHQNTQWCHTSYPRVINYG